MQSEIAAYNVANYIFDSDFRVVIGLLFLQQKKRKSPHKLYRKSSEEGAVNILVDRYLLDDATKFKEYFRLTPFLFSKLLEVMKDDLEGLTTTWMPKPITAHDKFCITLRYLVTGESFRSLAFQYHIVDKCLTSIIAHFLQEAIPTPTIGSFKQVINDYFQKWNFPNCCGAIDGKHVRIKCPPGAGSAYFNYKDFH